MNDMLNMVEMETRTPGMGRGRQSRGHWLPDMEDNRLDMDLVARPEARVQFVKRR